MLLKHFFIYQRVNLIEKLVESDWCANLKSLLVSTKNTEHDTVEKLLDSMLNLIDLCKANFQSSLMISLQNFKQHYDNLAKEEIDDDYFTLILKKIHLILESLSKTSEATKIEL